MLKLTEEQLLMVQEAREEMVERIDVLEKVKGLLLLPAIGMATTQQVADFYEVGVEAIQKIIQRNGDELRSDGYCLMTGGEVKKLEVDNMSVSKIVNKRGYFLIETDNGFVKIAYPSNGLFSKRAILRVGMLLRDSEVAKEVRTQLLNIEEKAPEVIKSAEINKEKQLALEVLFGETEEIRLKAFAEYNDNKNKHIEILNKIITEQKPKVDEFNKLISGNIFLTATEIASMYVGKNGIKVKPKDINTVLLAEGYIKKQGRITHVPSEKGKSLGGRVKTFKNGNAEVTYAEWSIVAVRELDKIFNKYNIVGKTVKEPVLS